MISLFDAKLEEDTEIDFSDEEEVSHGEEKQDESEEIPRELRKLHSQAYDKSISDLISMIDKQDMILNPQYQRNYIWDNHKASLLIESILLNIPIPIIYMAEDNENRWTVVDGLQRLHSLHRFLKDSFKLIGLEVLGELKGQKYSDLTPKAQRILNNGIIRTVVISQESHHEIKYDIFMRLNRGSIQLNEQELRNCLYRGSLNELLKELRQNEKFIKMIGISKPHKRLVDAEIVLRYLAISDSYDRQMGKVQYYKGSMKSLLNGYMEKHKNLSQKETQEITSKFNKTVENVYDIFGDNAFKKVKQDGVVDPRLNRAIHDCLMISFENKSHHNLINYRVEIVESFRRLMIENRDFYDSISSWTSDTNRLNYRLKVWNESLNTILDVATYLSV